MRKITQIILHCTATKEGQPVTVPQVTEWHKARGFNTIGYHYLIGLNGEVWKCRPEEQAGAHVEGRNANSIGVCYVGGLDANMKPKDTRTPAQKQALLDLLKELTKKYPTATIHGHREFASKACPCFDAKIEYKNL